LGYPHDDGHPHVSNCKPTKGLTPMRGQTWPDQTGPKNHVVNNPSQSIHQFWFSIWGSKRWFFLDDQNIMVLSEERQPVKLAMSCSKSRTLRTYSLRVSWGFWGDNGSLASSQTWQYMAMKKKLPQFVHNCSLIINNGRLVVWNMILITFHSVGNDSSSQLTNSLYHFSEG